MADHMSQNLLAASLNLIDVELPEQSITRSGEKFFPKLNVWKFRNGTEPVSINFESIPRLSEEFLVSFKAALAWYLRSYSSSHCVNAFSKMKHIIAFLDKDVLTEITEIDLMNYAVSKDVARKGYLSGLASFLKHWYQLGYRGVTKDAINFLNSKRLTGNPKGNAVRTMDPENGPLTSIETEAVMAALHLGLAKGKISTEDYLLVWLFTCIGMRPIQYASLKVSDLIKRVDTSGIELFSILIPRAKQRGAKNIRQRFKERNLRTDVGCLLERHVEEVKRRLKDVVENIDQAPMFPARGEALWAVGLEYHSSADTLSRRLTEIVSRLEVVSERTGKQLHLNPRRLRYSLGTRAAEEGRGMLQIAELLDHSDLQNVGVYVEATPAIIRRIDRAIAMHMAPLAQAFAGKLIRRESEATRAGDPSSRIIDLRVDRSGQPMGSCGQHSFCGFNAPIACYVCPNFEPWLDGPHEALLEQLIAKHESLRSVADDRIASINERTIFAVAEVVRRCKDAKASILESTDA